MNEKFYDGSDVDEGVLDQFETLPDGDYLVAVNDCEVRTAKNNPGCKYYAVEFEVVRGDFSTRRVWGNFTFVHHNETAVNIGRARMKQLCVSTTGSPIIDRPEQLYNKPITIRIRTKPGKDGRPSTNIIGIGTNQGIADKPDPHHGTAGGISAPASGGTTRETQSFDGPTQELDLDKVPF